MIYYAISLIGYGLVSTGLVTLGIIYSTVQRIMPYHLEALGIPWEDFSANAQFQLLNYQRSAAAGFITTGVAMMILLLIPFRQKKHWAYVTIFLLPLLEWGNIAYRTYTTGLYTPANPPLGPTFSVFAVLLISYISSMIYYSRS